MSHSLKKILILVFVFSSGLLVNSYAKAQQINDGQSSSNGSGAVLGSSNDADVTSTEASSASGSRANVNCGSNTVTGTTPTENDYAQYLKSNAPKVRNYQNGIRDPDNTALVIGGRGDACPGEYSLVCEGDTAVHCTTKVFAIDGGRPGHYDKNNATDGCRYADNNFYKAPTKNMIEPLSWNHNPWECGFAEGTNRLPCHYTWIFHDTSLSDIKNNQKLARNTASKYVSYDNGEDGGPNSDDTLLVTWQNWKNKGERYKSCNQWPSVMGGKFPDEPAPVTPVTPAPPAPAPAPIPPKDKCDKNWDTSSNCSDWDGCRQTAVKKLTLCNWACSLQECNSAYQSIAQPFPFGSNVDKEGFFAKNDINNRAQAVQTSISAFENAMQGNSFFGNNPDQCFFSRINEILGGPVDTPALSGTCSVDTKTPSLSQVSKDLSALTSDSPVSNLRLDTMLRSEFNLLDAFSGKRVSSFVASGADQNSGLLALVLKKSNATAAQTKATSDLINAIQDLSFDKRMASFVKILGDPQNRKYFSVGVKVPDNSQSIRDQVSQFNSRYTPVGHSECIKTPDSSSLDSFATSFRTETVTSRIYMGIENTCHPVNQSTECPAGVDKGNHCAGDPVPANTKRAQ